ncbi:glycoside hydrolase family 95 protein [Aspergillus melleus]|uniref:glycoside hydrolase family 95 protein n=1 Tax=Aspergillus melleus TaxID=138277 RepID=UPI001E8CF49E|nr:uncharacterized protein LDX57_001832 [Aspergillus melleus]KAH8424075.1 hypothetical protein LDX57_001832 [Aspergillus melleus]
MSELWYQSPAGSWDEALPVGNGRLGAMVYGRTDTELLQLNEDSVWYGGPQSRTPTDALRHLPQLRELIRNGDHEEAEKLVRLAFYSHPISQRHYEPLGTLFLEFGHKWEDVAEYRRSLDLRNGKTQVQYDYKGVQFEREILASHPDAVIAIRIRASESTAFVVRLSRMSELEYETNEYLDDVSTDGHRITMHATPGGRDSNKACCAVNIRCNDHGTVTKIGNSLLVNSRDVLLFVAAQTTYRCQDVDHAVYADLAGAMRFSTAKIWSRHINDYLSLYGRMELIMGPDASDLPTDERLKSAHDPGLIALYHNYCRYLLISCSRDGEKPLPATLQGIWNPSFHPPWGCKYTLNINLQMNYWPAQMSNLAECEMPLFHLLQRIAEAGKETAQRMYGCRGWTVHHCTDIWADTAPVDKWLPATLWPLGGAWLCTHIWENFRFNGNKTFLRQMFPVLRGCVEFLLDFLIEDISGSYLITNPSVSPENSFYDAHGSPGVLCEGSTIDIQLVNAVLDDFVKSIEVLGIDDTLLPAVRNTQKRLPPMRIGCFGQLQEWNTDFAEVEPGHRHVSHLWALYPGDRILPEKTPDLAEACSKTLQRRETSGGGHTGWSRAWLINLHARLRAAENCAQHLDRLLAQSTLPNLLDTHPPFQIDGNFGAGAGILEMLIQSHEEGIIRLLPACPSSWRTGSLQGVRARGGFELAFDWKDGMIQGSVVVRSLLGHRTVLYFPNDGARVEVQGEGVHLIKAPN